jgi:hypothetical protein
LTVLIFGAVFALVRPLAAGALFAGFIAAQLATFAGFLTRAPQVRHRDRDNG